VKERGPYGIDVASSLRLHCHDSTRFDSTFGFDCQRTVVVCVVRVCITRGCYFGQRITSVGRSVGRANNVFVFIVIVDCSLEQVILLFWALPCHPHKHAKTTTLRRHFLRVCVCCVLRIDFGSAKRTRNSRQLVKFQFRNEEEVDLCCSLLLMLLLLETVDGLGKLCVSVALAFSFSALTFRR
jgi:hypothetical protein